MSLLSLIQTLRGLQLERGQGETEAGNEGGNKLDRDECGKPPFITDAFAYTSTRRQMEKKRCAVSVRNTLNEYHGGFKGFLDINKSTAYFMAACAFVFSSHSNDQTMYKESDFHTIDRRLTLPSRMFSTLNQGVFFSNPT